MTNRINMSYGEEVNLIVMRKKTRTYNVFNEWLSARELLYLGQLHISEQRYSYGDKLWKTNKTVHLKMHKLLGAKSGAILEWDGSFHERSNKIFVRLSLFLSTNRKRIGSFSHKANIPWKSSTISWNFWINQHQVIFLAYRMYNPTVQSVRSLLKNIWSGQWMNFWILPITHQLEKGQS